MKSCELFSDHTSAMCLEAKLHCWARRFLPAVMRPRIKCAPYEYKNKLASNGAHLVPIEIPIDC